MGRKVMATVDGERCQVLISEAVLLQLAPKALTGEARAVREFLRIAEQVATALPNGGRPERLVIERRIIDPQDCNPVLDLLGIIIPVGERYRIAPWAVVAAMARKPGLNEAH